MLWKYLAGLLREIVVMQAFQMELTRKNGQLLDRLTFIPSLDYLTCMKATTVKEMDAPTRTGAAFNKERRSATKKKDQRGCRF